MPNSQHEYEGESAEHYDDLRAHDPKWQREQEAVRRYLHAVAVADSTVLDVPVGTGRFLPLYLELGCSVLGIDASEDMLNEARQVATGDQVLAQGDITHLDLDHSSVDVAVCVRLLNLVDLGMVQSALEELARVTRSHLIIGIRTRPDRPRLRGTLRDVRTRLRGRTQKLTVHKAGDLDRLLEHIGGEALHRSVVTEADDGSSTYYMYLIALSNSEHERASI